MFILIEVYNHDTWLGSFYIKQTTRAGLVKRINEEYGEGKWTRYNIGN